MGLWRRFKKRREVKARDKFIRRLDKSGTHINAFIAHYKQYPYLNEVIGTPVDTTQHQNGLSADARIIEILTKSENLDDKSIEVLAASPNVWLVNNLFSRELTSRHYLTATVFATIVNPDFSILTKLARDPRSTDVHLNMVCFPSDKTHLNASRVRETALSHPNMTSELIHKIVLREVRSLAIRGSQPVLTKAAQHEKLSVETARLLIEECFHTEALVSLAANPYINLPQDLVDALSQHKNPRVRLSMALHPHHPDRMFTAFMDEDVWEEYTKLVAKKHIVPAGTLKPSYNMVEHFRKQQQLFSEFKNYILSKASTEGLDGMPFNWLMRSYGLYAQDIPFDDWLSSQS